MRRDRIFLAHFVGEALHQAAVVEQAQRHLHRLRRLGLEDRKLLRGEVTTIRLQRREHLFQRVGREQPVDVGTMVEQPRTRGRDARRCQDRIDTVRVGGDRRLHLGQRAGRQIMRRQAQRVRLRPVEPVAGQRDELADPPRQARQIPTAADVGEQADPRFRHRELRILGGDAIAARQRDADAAAHRHAVHERDGRLGISEQPVIELVLGMEERPGRRPVARAAVGEHADIAARTEAARALRIAVRRGRVVNHHRRDVGIGTPILQRREHRLAHRHVERMQRTRPVQPQPPECAIDLDQNILGHGGELCRAAGRASIPIRRIGLPKGLTRARPRPISTACPRCVQNRPLIPPPDGRSAAESAVR